MSELPASTSAAVNKKKKTLADAAEPRPPFYATERRCFSCKKRVPKTMRGACSACRVCQHLFCHRHLNTVLHACPTAKPSPVKLPVAVRADKLRFRLYG